MPVCRQQGSSGAAMASVTHARNVSLVQAARCLPRRPVPFQSARHMARLAGQPCSVASQPVEVPSSSNQGHVDEQWTMLKDFTRKEFRGMAAAYLATPELRQKLREAVQAVYTSPNNTCGWNPEASQPDVLLGLMASDVRLGLRGLRDWCDALKLDFMLPEVKVPNANTLAEVRGTVYMKYNPKSQSCYVSVYHGKDRGVLVQLGQEQLGHFPLGLWDEEQRKPPPPLA